MRVRALRAAPGPRGFQTRRRFLPRLRGPLALHPPARGGGADSDPRSGHGDGSRWAGPGDRESPGHSCAFPRLCAPGQSHTSVKAAAAAAPGLRLPGCRCCHTVWIQDRKPPGFHQRGGGPFLHPRPGRQVSPAPAPALAFPAAGKLGPQGRGLVSRGTALQPGHLDELC